MGKRQATEIGQRGVHIEEVRARQRFRDAVLPRVLTGGRPVNLCGHVLGPVSRVDFFDAEYCASVAELTSWADRLERSHQSGRALRRPIVLGAGSISACAMCGERPVLVTDGQQAWAAEPCPYPHGMTIGVELNVPSGVLVVANYLSPAFEVSAAYNIDTVVGCSQHARAMAQIGCAHFSVGNSCPGVYRTGPRTLTVARCGEDHAGAPVVPDGERVAGIVTDAFSYAMADRDEFHRRVRRRAAYDVAYVCVEPGVWRFTHHAHDRTTGDRDDFTTSYTFTTITWVRPPDPVRDYRAGVRARDCTAGQVIADTIARWPSRYGGEDGVRLVAQRLFFSLEHGAVWHENGFPQFDPDMDPAIVPVPIPTFDARYRWPSLTELSPLSRTAGISRMLTRIPLNLSFVALARNILTCIVQHGSDAPCLRSGRRRPWRSHTSASGVSTPSTMPTADRSAVAVPRACGSSMTPSPTNVGGGGFALRSENLTFVGFSGNIGYRVPCDFPKEYGLPLELSRCLERCGGR